MPNSLRCLIVGENPGDVTSEYFYEPPAHPKRDRVRVRRELLEGLQKVGLIAEPTLEAFRDAGFLFDHGIRCPLPSATVSQERRKATRYASERAAHALHLIPWLKQARFVWVMGHVPAATQPRVRPRPIHTSGQPGAPSQATLRASKRAGTRRSHPNSA